MTSLADGRSSADAAEAGTVRSASARPMLMIKVLIFLLPQPRFRIICGVGLIATAAIPATLDFVAGSSVSTLDASG
jgi:hypothetical protein